MTKNADKQKRYRDGLSSKIDDLRKAIDLQRQYEAESIFERKRYIVHDTENNILFRCHDLKVLKP